MLLFIEPRIRPLLDFEQDRVFEHVEAVAAGDENEHVADVKLSFRNKFAAVGVQFHFATALANNENFAGAGDFSRNRQMRVSGDGSAGSIDDESDLLRPIRRRDELSHLRPVRRIDDARQRTLIGINNPLDVRRDGDRLTHDLVPAVIRVFANRESAATTLVAL